jgi:hypothetical protein
MRIAGAFHVGQALPADIVAAWMIGGRHSLPYAILEALRRVEADKLNEHRRN